MASGQCPAYEEKHVIWKTGCTWPHLVADELSDTGGGGWGGYCRCPSGQVYPVGDAGDACQSLKCQGGEKVSCNNEFGEWSNKSVKCNTDVLVRDGGGGWGGKCRCPSGQIFHVGDEDNS